MSTNLITDLRFIILVVVVIVALLAVLAIFKGKAFKFGLKSGDQEVELDVGNEKQTGSEQKQTQKEGDSVGDIKDVEVLKKAKVTKGTVNVNIGHSVGKDKK